MICEKSDFLYPLLADVYYPVIEQGAYGNVDKVWILNATVACFFAFAGRKYMQEIEPQSVNVVTQQSLIGRTKRDIRFSSIGVANSITNVLVTNIRDSSGNPVYVETSGPRAGESTLFEIATNEPTVGAFGKVEFYKVILRRSENQAVTV